MMPENQPNPQQQNILLFPINGHDKWQVPKSPRLVSFACWRLSAQSPASSAQPSPQSWIEEPTKTKDGEILVAKMSVDCWRFWFMLYSPVYCRLVYSTWSENSIDTVYFCCFCCWHSWNLHDVWWCFYMFLLHIVWWVYPSWSHWSHRAPSFDIKNMRCGARAPNGRFLPVTDECGRQKADCGCSKFEQRLFYTMVSLNMTYDIANVYKCLRAKIWCPKSITVMIWA